jgi:hypothetical protein
MTQVLSMASLASQLGDSDEKLFALILLIGVVFVNVQKLPVTLDNALMIIHVIGLLQVNPHAIQSNHGETVG